MSNREELLGRARKYTEGSGLRLVDELGYGIHGIVFASAASPPAATRPSGQRSRSTSGKPIIGASWMFTAGFRRVMSP